MTTTITKISPLGEQIERYTPIVIEVETTNILHSVVVSNVIGNQKLVIFDGTNYVSSFGNNSTVDELIEDKHYRFSILPDVGWSGSITIDVQPFEAAAPEEFVNTKSIQCTNANQYVNLYEYFAPYSQDPMTVVCWYKSTDRGWYDQIIGNKDQLGTRTGWLLETQPTTGYLKFIWVTTYDDDIFGQVYETDVADGTWRMIGATYDGSIDENGVILYVNGIAPTQVGLTQGTPVSAAQGGPLQFFSHADGTTALGTICDPAIYSRVLTPAEMLEIYDAGGPVDLRAKSSSDALLHYWWTGDDGDHHPICVDKISHAHGVMINMSPSNFVSDVP